ncbi:hypothetical protein [Dysosmobacter sp. Phy]
MTLRRWMILSIALMLSGFVMLSLSRTADVPAAGAAGGVLLAAGLVTELLKIRCPACGAHVRGFFGEYCKYCGEKLDWDKPPRS